MLQYTYKHLFGAINTPIWCNCCSTKRESKDNITAIKEFAGDIPVLPSIRESEQFKRAIRQGKLLSDIGQKDLQYPFEKMIEVLTNER